MATCDPNTTIQPCWMCRPEKELLAAMTGLLCDISTSGGGGGGSGTVTSVGMSVPAQLSVSGSPVTTSGTLAVTLNQTAFTSLTDAATVTWAMNTGVIEQTATVTLGGNRTLSITGATAGMRGVLKVIQDGTPPRTLALPGGSKVIGAGAGAITLSNAANAIDILSFIYDGTNYFWQYGRNFT